VTPQGTSDRCGFSGLQRRARAFGGVTHALHEPGGPYRAAKRNTLVIKASDRSSATQQVQTGGCYVDGVASLQVVLDVDMPESSVEGSRGAVMGLILSLLFGIADLKMGAKRAECRVFA
jgi:hypothetical protein